MRKFLLLFLLFVAFTLNATVSKSLFIYDKNELSKEFENLNSIENYVKTNNVTYSQLVVQEKDMTNSLSFNDVYNLSLVEAEPPLGIPSFWWGCVFGVHGMIVVSLITEDKSEVMKAFKGCIIGSSIILVAIIISNLINPIY